MEFTTLDQVEAHFQPLIAAAGDDAQRVMALRLERADAREAVRDSQDRERSLTEARTNALREFPYARQEELRGSTADEIAAAARASHEHVQGIIEQNRQRQAQQEQGQQGTEQQGRQQYGRGSGAGGGQGEPPAPANNDPWPGLAAEHDTLMAVIKSGAPFDAREVHAKAFVGAMDAIAERTLKKNVVLLDMGKATSAEQARAHRGGVQMD